MGATPIPHSAGHHHPAKNATLANSAYALLDKLMSQCPAWVRIVIVLALASATFLHILVPTTASKPEQAYSLFAGKQVAGPGDTQMEDATIHLREDDQHSRWHEEHPEDSPRLKTVFKISEDNFLAYKYYEKSDHCVFVIRRQNGATASRWLREPLGQTLNAAVRPRESAEVPQVASIDAVGQLLDALVPPAQPAALLGSFLQSGPALRTVQDACVAGVHPGQFTWWWGTPEDSCWTPMFRQWKDGCKHYQRYNRCANAWDESIHWVSCSASRHF
jgi:hypothetical protein